MAFSREEGRVWLSLFATVVEIHMVGMGEMKNVIFF